MQDQMPMMRSNRHDVFPLADYEAAFRTTPDPIIVTRFDITALDYSDQITSAVFSSSVSTEFVASCSCGERKGNYFIGQTCPSCKQPVKSNIYTTENLYYKAWIEAPHQISGWLHPRAYMVLSHWTHYSRFRHNNYINDILNPALPFPDFLAEEGIERGFQYFYENFDAIIDVLCRKLSQKNAEKIRQFVTKYRHLMFVRHLPIMASSLHPALKAETGAAKTEVDTSSPFILEAISTLSNLQFSPKKPRGRGGIDTTIFKAYSNYIAYISDVKKSRFTEKKSHQRQYLFGARMHWTFRDVIVPINGPTYYDHLHLPWTTAVNLFRVHILGRLFQRQGLTASAALARQQKALVCYDPDIDQYMQEFLDESSEGTIRTFDREVVPGAEIVAGEFARNGVPVLFNRNPSLKRGAVQKLIVAHIKKRISDASIGISVLVLADANADFDGDQLNGLLITERKASAAFEDLHPAQRYYDINKPGVGTNMTLPSQSIININSFLGNLETAASEVSV